jgi:hypothetical protein
MHRAWLKFRFQPLFQSLGLLPCSVASGDLAAAATSKTLYFCTLVIKARSEAKFWITFFGTPMHYTYTLI